MPINLRRKAGKYSLSPHLPFEFDIAVLDALTNGREVSGLLHGTDYLTANSNGSIDPMILTAAVDATGGKVDVNESFHTTHVHPTVGSGQYPYGGEVRQRRLRRPPTGLRGGDNNVKFPGWYQRDVIETFWEARCAGFTGIVNELYSWQAASPHRLLFENTFVACNKMEKFWCMSQLDVPSLSGNLTTNTPTAVANYLAPILNNNKSAYRNNIGIHVIGAFWPNSGTNTSGGRGINVPWLTTFFNTLQSASCNAAFMPMANGDFSALMTTGSSGMVQFARRGGTGGSWLGDWSKDTPSGVANQTANISLTRSITTAAQKLNYALCPTYQQCRHRRGWFRECGGLTLMYTHGNYMIANGIDGDHVHWVTWNDMAETAMCSGTGVQHVTMDIAAYYNYAFRTGSRPPIVRDVIYGAHRLHKWNEMPGAAQVGGSQWLPTTYNPNGSRSMMRNGGDAPNDYITMLAFCKAPCTIRIVHPNGSTVLDTYDVTDADVAAGPVLRTWTPGGGTPTLPTGRPIFQLIRGGVTLISMVSDFRIRGSITRFQDLEYKLCGSGRRNLDGIAVGHPNIEPVELVHDMLPGDPRQGSSG